MKRVISFTMILVLLFSLVSVMTLALTSNGFTYEVSDGEATITAYNDSSSSIAIPETLGGVPVTKIGDFAFADRAEKKGSDITSLTLPKTLKYIGDGAFSVNSTVTSVSIPSSVEYIGNRAFHCWISLTSVQFSGKNLKHIGDWAFRNCHSLASLNLPKSVETIGVGAFSYCTSLTSVELPASLVELGRDAFVGCTSLSQATLLNDDLTIGENAFDLTAINSSDSRTLVISGYKNSTAQAFASAEGFSFNTLAEPSPDDPTPDDPPASTSGDYCVKVTYTITGSNNIKASYGGYNKEVNDSAGISLLYKEKNGTADSYQTVNWDIKNTMTSSGTGTYTLTCSVGGFPYMLYGYLDDNAAGGSAAYNINKLEVGSSFESLKTVWTGSINLTSKINPFGISLDWDNNKKENYFNSDSNNKVASSSGKWEKPYAKTMSAVYESEQLSLDADKASVSNAFTYSAADQYGVQLDATLCTATSASAVSSNTSYITTTASGGSGSTTCAKQAHMTSQGSNSQSITTTFKWQGKDQAKTSTAAFQLYDEKYIVSFQDESGATLKVLEVYYGDKPSYAVPEKEPTDTYHFADGRWSPALTSAAAAAVYQAEYTQGEHTFALYEEYCTQPSCESSGSNVYYCTVCGMLKEKTVPALGHSYTAEVTKEPTCDETGITTYTCGKCGHSYTEVIEADGHHYDTTTVAPTCTEGGYTLHTCSGCGDHYTSDVLEALGHDWDAGVTKVNPTCTLAGAKEFTCSRCKAQRQENVEPLGHKFGEWTTDSAATCVSDGARHCLCERCSETVTETVQATGHQWGAWNKEAEATCEQAGEFQRICATCKAIDVEEIPARGHNFDKENPTVVAPEDGKEGRIYYTCLNGCGQCAFCTIDASGNKEVGEVVSQSDAQSSETDIVPTASFNTYNRTQIGYSYADRGASLRIDRNGEEDKQALRFTASMTLPEGVTIKDFGFVSANASKVATNPNRFVMTNTKEVATNSVKDGNYSVFHTDDGEVYTFNIVYKVHKSNWGVTYFVKPYIVYEYMGVEFTVYDQSFSDRSVKGVAQAALDSGKESKFVENYIRTKIFG